MSNALKSCKVCVNSTLALCIYSHLLFVELGLIWCAGFVPANGMYFSVTSRFPPSSTLYQLSSEIHCQLESWSVKLNKTKTKEAPLLWLPAESFGERGPQRDSSQGTQGSTEVNGRLSSTCGHGRCWSHCAATRSWPCSRERTTKRCLFIHLLCSRLRAWLRVSNSSKFCFFLF